MQSVGLIEAPSVLEHVLIDNEQYLPVDVVQSVVPQAQSIEFSTDPSVLAHELIAAVLEHLFNDD